jgi:hypothetical protein
MEMSENSVLQSVYGSESAEEMQRWRERHYEELQRIILALKIKLDEICRKTSIYLGERRNTYKIFVDSFQRKKIVYCLL